MGFIDQFNGKYVLLDGAMGTLLQESGLQLGTLPETLNIEVPQLIREIHQAYVAAGAQIISTNTFQANGLKLKDTGYSPQGIIQAGVRLAREAGAPLVALAIGPLGQILAPIGTLTFEEAYECFKEQVVAGAEAGADCILLETFSDLYELKAAILAAKENTPLPILCTMTFQQDGRTLMGTDPLTAVTVLQGLGVEALGINCSLGPEEILSLLQPMVTYSRVPLIVQPNGGMPQRIGDETVFPVTPEAFATYGKRLGEMGVQLLGGCCGTRPAHIAALRQVLGEGLCPQREVKKVTSCASATQTVILEEGITITGERINPTGKPHLKEALSHGELGPILGEGIDQVHHGAQILDVNVGLPGLDETQLLKTVVQELQGVVEVPLQIDSVNIPAIEGALRAYHGKAIVNSVNGKEKVMERLLPVVKHYGAAMIALTIDEHGIPETAEERLAVAEKIVDRAVAYGIPREDIIVDCLVLTAAAQQKMVQETLRAVALVKKHLGLKTTLGISNVSYGLPNRQLVNRTFLAAALGAGLDLPIMDPLSQEMMDTLLAYRVINGEDQEAKGYLQRYQGKVPVIRKSSPVHGIEGLPQFIGEGRKDQVKALVAEALEQGKGLDLIQEFFIPALDQVGKAYEEGSLFLPQLLRAAEAVKVGMDLIKGKLVSKEGTLEQGKILLATVQGDIHDIGKNIAKMLLENYGYQIVDLGKDVPPERIVEVVKAQGISLVGLSALMTTTVASMEATIKLLKREVPHCKIMVGGAVLNPEYAQRIVADFYALDAQAGVRYAKQCFPQRNSAFGQE